MGNTPSDKPIPRRASKQDRITSILVQLDRYQKEGCTPEEAVEKLTLAQYDFLVEQDVNLDNLLLTEQQQKAVKSVTRASRPKGLTYNKTYPQHKQDLYNNLIEFVRSQGADEVQPNKNFRDLDFVINGVKYKVVLSNPRTPKN